MDREFARRAGWATVSPSDDEGSVIGSEPSLTLAADSLTDLLLVHRPHLKGLSSEPISFVTA